MEDLTTGSLSRHLMKTASFMLVTMVFQTLYFLSRYFLKADAFLQFDETAKTPARTEVRAYVR